MGREAGAEGTRINIALEAASPKWKWPFSIP
jgi:hypothetical protein